jgi:hypothetical protein
MGFSLLEEQPGIPSHDQNASQALIEIWIGLILSYLNEVQRKS